MRATASTSPFGTEPSRRAATTGAAQRTNPRAVAERTVGCFARDIHHAGVARLVQMREVAGMMPAHEISMTSTRSPAVTVSTSAGTTAYASARASPPAQVRAGSARGGRAHRPPRRIARSIVAGRYWRRAGRVRQPHAAGRR